MTRHDPLAARRRGIAVIYQQPTLFPHLSVAENLSLALDAGSPFSRIDWAKRRSDARRLLEAAGATIDPEASADTLSIAEQQMVEIARALSHEARIVIMDEPTASLTVREVDRLLDTVRTLRAHGTAVVYISHRLDEVFSRRSDQRPQRRRTRRHSGCAVDGSGGGDPDDDRPNDGRRAGVQEGRHD